MQIDANGKPSNLAFSHNYFALYLYETLEKEF